MPVFAEAGVLIAGIHHLPWRQFLPAILLSNFGIALAYSALGEYAQQHQWLPLAFGVSVALPVLIGASAGKFLFREKRQPAASNQDAPLDSE